MLNGIIPSSWQPQLHAALRIFTGLLFLEHGTSKLFHWPTSAGDQPLSTLLLLAGILETVGGLLITIGFFTRYVAFVLAGEMAVAYFMAHMPNSIYPLINHGEAAILFCFIFLFFAAAGAGPYSVDQSRNS
jgi:putative oxidoreductase